VFRNSFRYAFDYLFVLVVLFLILCGCAWAVFVFQPFGQRHWALIAIALVTAVLVARLRSGPLPRPERVFGRSVWLAGRVMAGALGCWFVLIVWSALSAGGPLPSVKSDVSAIRVLTWNILHGSDTGMPWRRYGWPVRKRAIQISLAAAKPDILCVQEALEEQSQFIASTLPGHRRVGVGRDDGRSAGEQCSILFDVARFEELGGGTFWLEEPTDRPATELRLSPKRICTWVRLRDRVSGRSFRVYNTHQYLTEPARVAVRLILAKIDIWDPSDAVLIAGDFNAPPDTKDRRLFKAVGLISCGQLAGASRGASTYQFYGIRLRSLDDILVNRGWRVVYYNVLDVKPENTFPSDHFGVMADLVFEGATAAQNPDQGSRNQGRRTQHHFACCRSHRLRWPG
jgi:endonuclease/exonuclease/phosphatase family metal-dependent hydrolase